MYQGKFLNNQRSASTGEGTPLPDSEALSEELQELLRAVEAPENAPSPEPVISADPPDPPKSDAPAEAVPAAGSEAAPEPAPAPPANDPAPKKKKKSRGKHRSKGNPVITTIFYTLWTLMILGFFGGMYFVTNYVEDWLTVYEATRPAVRGQQIFQDHFAEPDWSRIHDLAGVGDTVFEDKEDFVSYMEQTYEGAEFTCVEAGAATDGSYRFQLKSGDTTVGGFTLTDRNSAPASIASLADLTVFPDWQLDKVSILFSRSNSVTIEKISGHTAYVNGIAVSDDYTVQITSCVAEAFLPAGTNSFQKVRQTVSGLLLEPEVTIMDADGNPSAVVYDEAQDMYIEQAAPAEISDAEASVAREAVQAYGLFMIEKAGKANLAKTWKSSTDIYAAITTGERWFSDAKEAEFQDLVISDYVRYSSKLFSVQASCQLHVTCRDDSTRDFPLNTTLFFEKQKSGSWMVIDMTELDVHQPVVKVCITFLDAAGGIASRSFVRTDAQGLFAPTLAAPRGQIMTGWAREEADASGTVTLVPVFSAGENGYITVPQDMLLEPMVLQPVFETTPESEAS